VSGPVHLYLSHPQVAIDPEIPVPRWSLSETGRRRTAAFALIPALRHVRRIVTSDETKAVETATIVAAALGLTPCIRPDMHENDRSATGFLPPPEFEATADRFFASPHESIRGWERAIDAQARIVSAVEATLAEAPAVPTLFVGHGGVGTLLACHCAGLAISRQQDQLPSGGCHFAFQWHPRIVLYRWLPMETSPELPA